MEHPKSNSSHSNSTNLEHPLAGCLTAIYITSLRAMVVPLNVTVALQLL